MLNTIIGKIKEHFELKKALKVALIQLVLKQNTLVEVETRRAELDVEVSEQAKILNSMLNVDEDEITEFVNIVKTFVNELKINPDFKDNFYKRVQENK